MGAKENYEGARITELWVFVGVDEDGDEGVMAATLDPTMGPMPLIAADHHRRIQLEPVAQAIALIKGGTYECRHFVRDPDE